METGYVIFIGVIVVLLMVWSFRFFVRLAILFFALLAIWWGLAYIGLLPSPADYFNKNEDVQTKSTHV